MTEANKAAAPAELARAEDKVGVMNALGVRFGVDGAKLLTIVRETCYAVPKGETAFSNEELFLAMTLCHRYHLDPFAKEVYLFRGKGGKVQPIIGLDGWVTLANRQEAYDGCELTPVEDAQGQLKAYRCAIYRKDRTRPTVVVEDLAECRRNTEPWNAMPRRMLRGKAFAQGVRLAFGVRAPADEADAVDEAPAELTPSRVVGTARQAREVAAPEPTLVSSGPVEEAHGRPDDQKAREAEARETMRAAAAKLPAAILAAVFEDFGVESLDAALRQLGTADMLALAAACRKGEELAGQKGKRS